MSKAKHELKDVPAVPPCLMRPEKGNIPCPSQVDGCGCDPAAMFTAVAQVATDKLSGLLDETGIYFPASEME